METAKRRTDSSTRWLQRQLDAPYVTRAREEEGYKSRAVFKLIELNDKHALLKPGMRVVDLGCVPGGWLKVAMQLIKSTPQNPKIVGIDYLEMEPIPGAVILQKFYREDASKVLIVALKGAKADLALSYMAAPTTGHKPASSVRIIALVEMAAEFSVDILAPGGTFVAKIFQGGTETQL